jgi:adenylate cyclase
MKFAGEGGLLPAAAGMTAVLALVIGSALDPWGVATAARERAFDALYAFWPRSPGTSKVVVIDIDRPTIARFGGWPLPRIEIARIVDILAGARTRAIGFDIFFEGPDRYSPKSLALTLGALPGGEAVRPLAPRMPDTDARFAEALGKSPTILGALAVPGKTVPFFNMIGDAERLRPRRMLTVDGYQGPYPELAEAAQGLGIQSLFGEDDGLVRRAPLLFVAPGGVAPGLALEIVRVAQGAAMLSVDPLRDTVSFGSGSASLADGGAMRIHWSDPSQWRRRTISADHLLDGKIAGERLAGAVALIGSSAPEAGALRPTAADVLTPSVQIEAEAVEQLLSGVAPRPLQFASLANILASLLLGLAGIRAMLSPGGPVVGAVGLLGLIALWLGFDVAVFLFGGVLIDPIGPAAAAVIGGNVAAGAVFARTRKLKSLISQRFEQYLAPDVVRVILTQPEKLKREGEMRNVTALFTDIEDFTRMTTQLQPKALIALLDPYFDGVCRIITEHGGMIDLIVGDAVHAFFNMPLDLEDHADRAVDCAIAIVEFSEAFCRTPVAAAVGFGRTRIGVETGMAIVGDVGGSRRLNYTAHGPVSNAAARLEAANKTFGTNICIGPGAATELRRSSIAPVGRLTLRGFSAPVEVFTPDDARLSSPRQGPRRSGSVPKP